MMNKTVWARSLFLLCFGTLLVLAGCGGGGGSASASSNGAGGSGTYTIGGTVSGLDANSAVTLLNNGGDPIAITANGAFTFTSGVSSGSAYAVALQSHTPGIACTVSNGSGTVGSGAVTSVAVTCGAGTLRVLHSFDSTVNPADGQSPSSTLVADSNGNLYGTTQGGGTGNCPGGCGTVFKISTVDGYSVIHNFAGGANGGVSPFAGLAIDSAGNLYGTTYEGGLNGTGTVFKINPTIGLIWSHSLNDSVGEGSNPIGGLVIDANGDLYGTRG